MRSIRVPSGRIYNFPTDATDEEISAFLAQQDQRGLVEERGIARAAADVGVDFAASAAGMGSTLIDAAQTDAIPESATMAGRARRLMGDTVGDIVGAVSDYTPIGGIEQRAIRGAEMASAGLRGAGRVADAAAAAAPAAIEQSLSATGIPGAGLVGAGIDKLGGLLRRAGDFVGGDLDQLRREENARRIASGQQTLEEESANQVTSRAASSLSGAIDDASRALKSDYANAISTEMGKAIDGGLASTAEFIADSPAEALSAVLGGSAAYLIPGLVFGRLTKAAGAGEAASTAAAVQGVGAITTAQGAEAARDLVMDMDEEQLLQVPQYAELRAQNYSHEQAKLAIASEAYDAAASTGAVLNAATGAAAQRLGLTPVEEILAGGSRSPGVGRIMSAIGAGLKEVPGEGLQGGGEQIAQNLGGISAGTMDPRDAAKGVASNALLEAAAGGVTGTAVGGIAPEASPRKVAEDRTSLPTDLTRPAEQGEQDVRAIYEAALRDEQAADQSATQPQAPAVVPPTAPQDAAEAEPAQPATPAAPKPPAALTRAPAQPVDDLEAQLMEAGAAPVVVPSADPAANAAYEARQDTASSGMQSRQPPPPTPEPRNLTRDDLQADLPPAQTGYAQGVPRLKAGEESKPYLKRNIDTLPDPTPEQLPSDSALRYFSPKAADAVVPMSALRATKVEEPGNAAMKRMAATAAGVIAKRDAIDVRDNGDGTYTIVDGNGSYNAALKVGLKDMPVRIVEAPAGREPWRQNRGLLTPDQDAALLGMYEQAARELPTYEKVLKSIASQFKGKPLVAPLKGLTRAEEKIAIDYGGDASQIKDLLRGTLVFDTPQQAIDAANQIRARFTTVKDKDHLSPGTPDKGGGYRDINFVVRMPGGTMAEIQVMTAAMKSAKDAGHKHYEIARSVEKAVAEGVATPEELADYTAAVEAMKKIYAEAAAFDSAATMREREVGDQESGLRQSRAATPETGTALPAGVNLTPEAGGLSPSTTNANTSESLRSENTTPSPSGGMATPSNTSATGNPSSSEASIVPDSPVDRVIAKVVEAIGLSPGVVTVVDSPADLPRSLRRGLDSRTEGIYDPDTGKVYLFRNALPSPSRAVWVAMHELSGHKGLRALLKPEDFAKTLDRAGTNPLVQGIARAIEAEARDEAGAEGARQIDPAIMLEEAIAELSAAYMTGDFDALFARYGSGIESVRAEEQAKREAMSFIRRLITDIKRALFNAGAPMSDAEVVGLIRNAYRSLRSGAAPQTTTVGAMQSRVPLSSKWMTEDFAKARKQLGLSVDGENKVRDVGEALDAYVAKHNGRIDPKDRSDEAMAKIAAAMADEVMVQLGDTSQQTGSGVGWYSVNYPNAVRRLASRFPELDSDSEAEARGMVNADSARNLFTMILAVTSNGEKVRQNLKMATEMFAAFREGASLRDSMPGTRRAEALENNIEVIEQLISRFGMDGIRQHLLSEMTVKEINAELRKMGEKPSSEYTADMTLPRSALYFGAKLGAFYANLAGSTGYLTMDLWWSCSFNRYRANMLPAPTDRGMAALRSLLGLPESASMDQLIKAAKPHWRAYKDRGYKDGSDIEKKANTFIKAALLELNEAPTSATERKFMVATAVEAQRRLRRRGVSLTLADIQAALWYYEKRLYDGLGVRGRDDIGYEEAINEQAQGDRPDGPAARGGGEGGDVGDAGRSGAEADGARGRRAGRGLARAGRDARGQDAGAEPQPVLQSRLPGAPVVKGFDGPDPRLVAVAEQYARDNGIQLRRQAEYVKVDPERAKRIADAYEAMEHAPNDPRVRAAYRSLIDQTVAQYRALEAAGYRFWFIDLASEAGQRYTTSPWNAMRDIRANQSMGVFPTAEGFGSGATELDVSENPLLEDTGIRWPFGGPGGEAKPVLANDLFRAVHDAFGHGLEGAGFRADGEENAWQAHVRLFTGPAVGAITSETRGQNSWLNYGPFGERNRTASAEETVFADQKTGLMPEWTWLEGRAGDMQESVDGQEQASTQPAADGQPGVRRDGAPSGGVGPLQSRSFPADAPAFRQRKQQADAVSAQGIHYSGVAGLTSLDGKFAGAGSAGAERRRFGTGQYGERAAPGDTGRRLYFYVQEGDTAPRKEDAVAGNNRYAVLLQNLYDYEADPRGLREEAGANMDYLEELVNDAGFDGMLLPPLAGIDGKIAILHGLKKKVPVASAPLQSRAPQRPTPGQPTPLYVDRPVVDDGGLRQWAIDAGLTDVLSPEELHVTVTYSRSAVDVSAAPAATGSVAARPAGRAIQLRSALAMPLLSIELQRGHRRYRDAGASHDYGDEYTPHITLKYDPTPDEVARLEAAPPFTGRVILGPERQDILRPGGEPAAPMQSRSPSTVAARVTAAMLRERKSQLAAMLSSAYAKNEQLKAWTVRARTLIGEVATSRDFAAEIADAKQMLGPERRELLKGDRDALKRYDEIRDMIGMLEVNQRAVRGKAIEANRLIDKIEKRDGGLTTAERDQFIDQLGESLEQAERAYLAMKAIADWRASNDAKIVKAYKKRNEALSILAADGFTQGSLLWTGGSLMDRKDSVMRKLRRAAQDKLIDLRDIQQQIEIETGRAIEDAQNAYLAENQMHGKVADRIKSFEESHVDPLKRAIKESGLSHAQVELYLWAKHAAERNAKIAAINPGVTDGSGMTDEEAQSTLASFSAEQTAKLEGIGRRIEAIRRHTLATLLEAGQIDQATHDTILGSYKNYVPLRGKDGAGEQRVGGTGRGISAGGAGITRALGRKTPPKNVLAELVGDAERAIVQAGKADVGRALLRLVLSYPNKGLWELNPVKLEPTFNKATGEVYLAVTQADDEVSVIVKHNGKPYRVVIHHPELVAALKNTGTESAQWVVQYAGAITRWLSAVMTRFNPGFVPINLMRDILQGLTGIASELGNDSVAKVIANYRHAVSASYRQSQQNRGDSSKSVAQKNFDDWAREFMEAGGATGWSALEDVDTLQQDIENSMKPIAQLVKERKPLAAASQAFQRSALFQKIESVNDGIENGLRLATYIHLRKDKGWSREKAAEYAKEMTVNFNRRGTYGSAINALYLFFNAAVQGSRRTIRLIKQPKVQAVLGGIASAQLALAATVGMMTFGDGDDEDPETLWEKIPQSFKNRNFVIPLGFKDDGSPTYIGIPMPFGFNIFPSMGGYIANFASPHFRAKNENPIASTVGHSLSTIIDALSPVGLGEDFATYPTVINIAMQMATGRDSLGIAISPSEVFSRFDAPRSEMATAGTPEVFHVVADALNRIGLGDDYFKPTVLRSFTDVSPNDIEFLFEQVTGGVGRIITQTWRAALKGAAQGPGEVRVSDIPIVRSLAGDIAPERDQMRRFYENVDSVERNKERLRDAFAEGGIDRMLELQASLGPAYSGLFVPVRKKTTENGAAGSYMVDPRTGRPELNAQDGSIMKMYSDAARDVKELNSAIRMTYNDNSMSQLDRQRRIAELNAERAAAVSRFNVMMSRARVRE